VKHFLTLYTVAWSISLLFALPIIIPIALDFSRFVLITIVIVFVAANPMLISRLVTKLRGGKQQ
jgi:hypothetical protein